MRPRALAAGARAALLGLAGLAAIAPAEPSPECAAILARTSSAWVDGCAARRGDSPEAVEAALARYGECYDAATDAVAARLAEADSAAAGRISGCLPALQSALESFGEYALGAALNRGTYSRVATAYASLYEKQLRRLAYEAAGAPPSRSDPAGERRLDAARSRLAEILSEAPPRLRADLEERFAALRDAGTRCGVAAAPLYELAIHFLKSPDDPPFTPPPF